MAPEVQPLLQQDLKKKGKHSISRKNKILRKTKKKLLTWNHSYQDVHKEPIMWSNACYIEVNIERYK